MIIEEYQRTELIITEFDREDVITTSGPSLDKYESRALRFIEED